MRILRQIHNAIRARFVRYFRLKEIERQFAIAHAQELRITPVHEWPMVQARHTQELQAVRRGSLPLNVTAADITDRKSWAWPFMPASVTRLSVPIQKITPYNIRRMSRTPVPRRAINLIKSAVLAQPWEIRPLDDVPVDDQDEQKERIRVAQRLLRHPNNQDSFQTWLETSVEDMCILGAFATELRLTMDINRPIKMWPVNIESVRVFASWTESTPDMPHYAQMTGLKGERGAILFYDDELMYVKDNPSTDNPFGLGKMEVAFQAVNDFLGVQYMAGRAGADTVHKSWLWWEQPQTDAAYQIVRRHIQNELEGQAKVSIIGGMKKPEVIEIQPTREEDLLLNWQEMLIRMVANAFDMSAMALGIEHDVNRAMGYVLDDKDFRSAVVPMAKRVAEAITRRILHAKLGWDDLEFAFLNLDDPDKQTMSEMLARMYSANAVTPNEWRVKMGFEELESPFADLTQFEAMMINMEAQMKIAQQAQDKQAERQQALQPPPQPPGQQTQPSFEDRPEFPPKAGLPHPGGPPKPGFPSKGGFPPAPGGGPKQTTTKTGQPSNPPKLALPKFPIAGSKYTAKEIAQMPVNHLADLWRFGQLPKPSKLLKEMHLQEPGILEEMTEEIREFFEEALQKEEEEERRKLEKPVRNVKEWRQKQARRLQEDESRPDDFATWLVKRGQQIGKPGGGPPERPYPPGGGRTAGTPGNINPIRKV